MQSNTNSTSNKNTTKFVAPAPTPATPHSTPQAKVAAGVNIQAQQQRLQNAQYVLLHPSKANLQRAASGKNTQAQTNANYAAAIMLQVYPLLNTSGLTPAQQQQAQQHMLQLIYTLQNAASIPTNKQAVMQVLPNA